MTQQSGRYRWFSVGDMNGFFGLMFDNMTVLSFLAGILVFAFGFPADIVYGRMFPGTALGVLFGDLIYTWMAFRLARRTGRDDVTAMPLGIDTVSLFGLSFGVLGPVFVQTHDATLAWQVGMAVLVLMGVFKIAVSFFAARIQRLIPPGALLGTIGGVGVLLIAFFPLLKIFAAPLIGLPALMVVLLCLLRGLRLPALNVPPV